MSSPDSLADRVRAFVARETGNPIENIGLETTLAGDLGLAGVDADQFLEAYMKEFAVAPESFAILDFDKHFGEAPAIRATPAGCVFVILFLFIVMIIGWLAETYGPWVFLPVPLVVVILIVLCRRRLRAAKNAVDEIRIRDLVDAAQAKKWLRGDGVR